MTWGMARRLRFIPPGSLVEVTTRTIQERLLLRPSEELNDIIRGVIGRAQALFRVRIHAFIVLSNHWHGLLSVKHAQQLASFMAFVNGNIAREVARIHNWRDRVWAGRYSAIVVADNDAAVARLRYLLSNGCKEGLVDRPAQWPGVSCVEALTKGKTLSGTWYDRTAECHARRGSGERGRQVAIQYEITLDKLPGWDKMSPSRYRASCADLVNQIESETRSQREGSGRACSGVDRVLTANPHRRPVAPSRSAAPLVHASCVSVRMAFRAAYAAFVDAFRAAAAVFRLEPRPDFPESAFPPSPSFVSPAPAVS